MESQGEPSEDKNGKSASTWSSVSSMWPLGPLPCTFSSILNMNCRARAEDLARSMHSKIRQSPTKDDAMPLHVSKERLDARSFSIDTARDERFIVTKPLHVVTSEPTIHLNFSPTEPYAEEDSDLHYDFGLVTPEDSIGLSVDPIICGEKSPNKSPGVKKSARKWSDSKRESSERPESGCATSITSPVMFRDSMLSNSPNSPSEMSQSQINAADLRAVREILSFSSIVDEIQDMTYSLAEMSAIDSGLYTEADMTMDSSVVFTRDRPESNDREDSYLSYSDFNAIFDSCSDAKNFNNISPPDVFRNSDIEHIHGYASDKRRRSFDLPLKMYQQQPFRRSSPPGYRSGINFPESICMAVLPNINSSNSQQIPVIKKRESEVVCTSLTGRGSSVKIQLSKIFEGSKFPDFSTNVVSSRADTYASDRTSSIAPCPAISGPAMSPDERNASAINITSLSTRTGCEAWRQDKEAESAVAASANTPIGTVVSSWHSASLATTSSADAGAAASQSPPQLIEAPVCGEPVSCIEACPSGVPIAGYFVSQDLDWNSDLTSSEDTHNIITTMRDECEPAVASFSRRRRRYKVTEGQAMSSSSYGESCSNDDPVSSKVDDANSLNLSEGSSEPSSPGTTVKEGESSEPTSPLTVDSSLPLCWANSPTKTSSPCAVNVGKTSSNPNIDDSNISSDTASESKLDENGEDDSPPIIEGKFKHLLNYKEKVRGSPDSEDDAFDPSITTIIQLDESELSEPEEPVPLQGEMEQLELGVELSTRLSVEAPEMTVQAPSDESSRESSDDPTAEDVHRRFKRSSSLKYGKTPPGTPGTKKMVRFADSLGLDLAECRTYFEGVPHVPKSAFGNLDMRKSEECGQSATNVSNSAANSNRHSGAMQKKMLMPLFQQPCVLPGYLDRVRMEKVALETISVSEDTSVRGYIRVLNIDFHKHVVVRYTFDGWRNFHEVSISNY